MRRALFAACLLVPAIATLAAAQPGDLQGCVINEDGIDCRQQGVQAQAGKAWYQDPIVWVEVGAVTASIGGGAFAAVRIRKKRRTLTEFLVAVETTYVEAKGTPGPGVERLVALRREVRALHGRGRLDDGQFLELDKRVTDHIARLRRYAVDQTFPGLPAPLAARLEMMVMDGTVSRADIDASRRAAVAAGLPALDVERIVAMMTQWALQDEGEQMVAAAPKEDAAAVMPAAAEGDDADVPDEAWASR